MKVEMRMHGLLLWLKRILGLKKRGEKPPHPTLKEVVLSGHGRLGRRRLGMRPRSKPRKAVHQDIGKWMKHGRQASWYRKTVKARISPEED